MTEPESEHWTVKDVAHYAGIKPETVQQQLSRGAMPEPDLIWLRHPLWLPETIKEWRETVRGKGGKKQGKRGQLRKVKPVKKQSRTTGRPPRLKRAPSTNGASADIPQEAVISVALAKQIAATLREEGHYATTADVMALAGSEHEDDHERDVLRQRVQRKIRGLKARTS